MPDHNSFAAWMKQRRKSLDLTRDELARRAHCSASAVRRLEAGDLRPSKQLAETLAAALGIAPEQREAFVRFARGESAAFDGFGAGPPSPSLVTRHASQSLTGNLPAPLTGLVGRKRAIAAVCDLLGQESVRLLTLTGPPGVGKTRLSLAAAERLASSHFPDGAHFVALAPIRNPPLVASAIAQALGVREPAQAAGSASPRLGGLTPLVGALKDFLRPKRLLLVLDNFEQVAPAAPLVADLLSAAPGLKALVTSREVLRLYGEHEFPVPALDFPDIHHLPSSLARSFYARFPAMQLFQQRARAVKADFRLTPENAAEVARICAWLDGLPLAIEMAASQVKWLPTSQVYEQLSDRLATLSGGPRDLSPRQQSLAGAIAWSYDLLEADEQRIFRLLGVFLGGFTTEAVQAVSGAAPGTPAPHAILELLVARSLAQAVAAGDGQPGRRYALLETIREYARDRLAAHGELPQAGERHAEFYQAFALTAAPKLYAREQLEWLKRFDVEQDNLRAALDWRLAHDLNAAAELAGLLAEFWAIHGHYSEGRAWLEKLLARGAAATASDMSPASRAEVYRSAGFIARWQGDWPQAAAWSSGALALLRQLGDAAGTGGALRNLAYVALMQRDYTQALELGQEALANHRAAHDLSKLTTTLTLVAEVRMARGEYAPARAHIAEALELSRELGDQRLEGHALMNLGSLARMEGDIQQAIALIEQGLELCRKFGAKSGVAEGLHHLGKATYQNGDTPRARQAWEESLALWTELGQAAQAALVRQDLDRVEPPHDNSSLFESELATV